MKLNHDDAEGVATIILIPIGLFIMSLIPACSTTEDPSLARRAVERGGSVYCGDTLVGPRQTARKLARIAGRRIEDVCEIMQDDSI